MQISVRRKVTIAVDVDLIIDIPSKIADLTDPVLWEDQEASGGALIDNVKEGNFMVVKWDDQITITEAYGE